MSPGISVGAVVVAKYNLTLYYGIFFLSPS